MKWLDVRAMVASAVPINARKLIESAIGDGTTGISLYLVNMSNQTVHEYHDLVELVMYGCPQKITDLHEVLWEDVLRITVNKGKTELGFTKRFPLIKGLPKCATIKLDVPKADELPDAGYIVLAPSNRAMDVNKIMFTPLKLMMALTKPKFTTHPADIVVQEYILDNVAIDSVIAILTRTDGTESTEE